MSANSEAAEALESNARTIAENACSHLLHQNQEITARFGDKAQQVWTDHLKQRIMELAAALAADDSKLFASGLAWSKTAMQSRALTPEDLYSSLQSLQNGIATTLEGESQSVALNCLTSAMNELSDAATDNLGTALDPAYEHDRLALQYVQSVVAGNIVPGMQLVMDAVARGMPVADAYLRVLLPAQQEVGRLWHVNELSVSEEHIVSHTTQRLMAILSTRVPRKPDNGYTAIAGTVAGNIHDLGIRAIAYLLEFEGWRTIYLGSDVPRVELPELMENYDADVFLMSLALTSQVPAMQKSIREIRKRCKKPVKIMVGGNGFAGNPDLWKRIGADGYTSDAMQALEMALKLVSEESSNGN